MSEKRTILIIEDEHTISNFICRALSANDYKPIPAASGQEGLSLFFSHGPDLVLLDLGLPDMDGLDVLSQLRDLPREVPVIIISARDRESEKVKALDMGADDYVVKPFGIMELQARVKALLRRTGRPRSEAVITCGDLEIDPAAREVRKNGALVELTYKEFELLRLLASRRGMVLTRDDILQAVWDYDFAGETRTVDMHVKTLRQKLETVISRLFVAWVIKCRDERLSLIWDGGLFCEKTFDYLFLTHCHLGDRAFQRLWGLGLPGPGALFRPADSGRAAEPDGRPELLYGC